MPSFPSTPQHPKLGFESSQAKFIGTFAFGDKSSFLQRAIEPHTDLNHGREHGPSSVFALVPGDKNKPLQQTEITRVCASHPAKNICSLTTAEPYSEEGKQ